MNNLRGENKGRLGGTRNTHECKDLLMYILFRGGASILHHQMLLLLIKF